MAGFEQDDLVGLSLSKVHQPDPPSDLTRAVMARVAEVETGFSPWRRWRRAQHAKRMSMSERRVVATRRLMWGLAGMSAAAVIVLAIIGNPAVGRGTEGTIGVATYAVSDPAVQQFLQSETFLKLKNNASTRAALQTILANPALAEALANPALVSALNDPALQKALANPSLRASVASALR
jgi:hypothetical protein